MINHVVIIVCNLLFLCHVTLCVLPPVIFLPGYAGSELYAEVADVNNIPLSCEGIIPIGQPFRVLGNVTMVSKYPECVHELMKVEFNESSLEFLPREGIHISTKDFGSFNGMVPGPYKSFERQLNDWGYETGKDLFGAPYDYRYLSVSSLKRIGFIDQLKGLVEAVYTLNNYRKVILIGHSNGGPTLYAFLSSLESSWKDSYVAGIIPLSGNFLGTMNVIKSFIYSQDSGRQEMVNSWEAQYTSFAWGGYSRVKHITVVTTFVDSPREKTYNPSPENVNEMLISGNRPDWALKFQSVLSSMNRSAEPGVDCFCFYGSEVTTPYAYVMTGNILTSAIRDTQYMDGDGNQDMVDNDFCKNWIGGQRAQGFALETQAFPGVRHLEMVTNDDVMTAVKAVLESYDA